MALDERDFEYIRDLVLQRAAIVIESSKGYLVESRLDALIRQLHLGGAIADLVGRLRTTAVGALHEQVVDAMTTNETSFFRDVQPFDVLRSDVLPQVIEQRRSEKEVRIWCGACSSGQEPYSIAMLIREHFPALRDWKVPILASDLSPSMVGRAREGRFSQLEVNRGLPAHLLVKWFAREGTGWVIDKSLRDMIEFREMNLVRPWPAMAPVDVVFMRNVLIYFEVGVKKDVLMKLRRVLRPGGFLFLGAAETTMNLDDAFARAEFQRASCFRFCPG